MMSMAHLKYSLKVSWLVRGCARVISSDTGLGGIHYCWAVPLVSSTAIHCWYPLLLGCAWGVQYLVSSTAIHCWYPLLLGCASGAGLCGGDACCFDNKFLIQVLASPRTDYSHFIIVHFRKCTCFSGNLILRNGFEMGGLVECLIWPLKYADGPALH